ncbi:MAG: adenine phosphoribosyltransferase [Hyphomicrobiaceae bacterium]|nr:adenine phosphoribosyltransferase [Hyphomicrobiaceae bacterium]
MKEYETLDSLKNLVRAIPDYPKSGIMFRDITTLLSNPEGFKATVSGLCKPYKIGSIDTVVAIEARGFILGGAMADRLACGFVPLRKKGKLPYNTITQEYTLEYGTDAIEIHADAIDTNARVVIVDDLIATGGTAEASVKLIKQFSENIVGASFVIDISMLGGRQKLEKMGYNCNVLIEY